MPWRLFFVAFVFQTGRIIFDRCRFDATDSRVRHLGASVTEGVIRREIQRSFTNHGVDSFRRILRARYSLISLCRGTGWQTFVTGF